jgi:hypothetical protein
MKSVLSIILTLSVAAIAASSATAGGQAPPNPIVRSLALRAGGGFNNQGAAIDVRTNRAIMVSTVPGLTQPPPGRPALVFVNASTGVRMRTVALPPRMAPSVLAIDAKSGDVVVAATKSTPSTKPISSPTEVHILVLDGRTGRMVRDIALRTTRTTGVQPSLGDQPAAAGMDTVTRNLFDVGVSPLAVAIDRTQHRAFVQDTRGNTVYVLDTGTGAVLGHLRLGKPVNSTFGGVSVDTHTHRAFVFAPGHMVVLNTAAWPG